MIKITRFCCFLVFFFSVSGISLAQQSKDSNATAEETLEVKDKQYVTDKLRLSLYKQADAKSGTIKLLTSGDALEILERAGPYSKVRTAEGDIGWVKNGFLVSTPTASFLLLEEQKKNQILAQQLEQYSDTKNLVADYENTISKMTDDYKQIEQSFNESNQKLEQFTQQNEELNAQIAASQEGKLTLSDLGFLLKNYWYFVVISILVLFVLGLVVGREMVEAKVRRKFQGVKVW